MSLHNVNLEMSLKPFGDPSLAAIEATLETMFSQWLPLCRRADCVSVMLWSADGSEILDYCGCLTDSFEWANMVGRANWQGNPAYDPEDGSTHSRGYLYMDNPPDFSYAWLKDLVRAIRDVGTRLCGKPIRVGTTFDPGPEFARSTFKYEKHPEICMANTMGWASFVCCYATLKADDGEYAGFPNGIPEGTTFGSFLGRQSLHFCQDLGFDFLWLSNGFGFGLETWSYHGAVFDGVTFDDQRVPEVRKKILGFWHDFRHECPDLPLETRGTNFSLGMDLSSDAVPLAELYRGDMGFEPPPNSPWAAINGDFGLELVGWMSKIAELPGEDFSFRFYAHDPWWNNSPWLDRYERSPHDIYLPMSVARIGNDGEICCPSSIGILSVDDSWGDMPEIVPREVRGHMLACLETAPDQAGPFVWVYPFDEYHDQAFVQDRLDDVFFGDWYMRGAVNHGFPLNTVISTRILSKLDASQLKRLMGSVLVSPVPDGDTEWESALLGFVEMGGMVLLYGPLDHASSSLHDLLGVSLDKALEGEGGLSLSLAQDVDHEGERRFSIQTLRHHSVYCGGGLSAVGKSASSQSLASMEINGQRRELAMRALGGKLIWLRGTACCNPEKPWGRAPASYSPQESFPGECLLRLVLAELGWSLRFVCEAEASAHVCTISRHRNGFVFSGYAPDTTVSCLMCAPFGAPLLLGHETRLDNGHSCYAFPRSWRYICRAFVEQTEGKIGCRVVNCESSFRERHRYHIRGLNDATLRFFPETGSEEKLRVTCNDRLIPVRSESRPGGSMITLEHLTGDLSIAW